MEKASLKIQLLVSSVSVWMKSHRSEFLLLISILFAGAFLRLYRIGEYMTFLGDEGRDAIIVRNLLVYADPILVGPGTSIGNMYLGPLYYYLIAPFLYIFNFSPVGPSIMVALFGIATIFLVWWVSREWFGAVAASLAAFFYAIAPVVIIYNRSSWNPNIMPFFSLLCVYAVWRIWKGREWIWLPVLGFSYAFVLQSHYLGLLLGPMLAFFIGLTIWSIYGPHAQLVRNKKQNDNKKYFLNYMAIGIAIFLFLMSPLVIFDARHEWRNANAIKLFFTERQTTVSAKPWNSIPKLWPLWEKINTRLLTGTNVTVGTYTAAALIAGLSGWFIFNRKKRMDLLVSPYLFVFLWLGVALLGLGNYKQEIYDHYYGFFFAAPFILFGGITQELISYARTKSKTFASFVYLGVILSIIVLLIVNVTNNPLQYPPNRQLQRSELIAEKVMTEGKGKPLNFAVIAERNYEGAYQYFIEKENYPVIKIDPQNTENTITEQLFVICELPKEKCDPTHNPKTEIANFGWSRIEEEWTIEGVEVYKLVHNQ